MTQEQREHIATTIAMLEMAATFLSDDMKIKTANELIAQCQILQEVLDSDCEEAAK